MMVALTLSTTEVLSVVIPVVLGVVGWASWVTKMVWDIHTNTKVTSARHDERLDDHEERLNELENLFPRTVNPG